MGAMDCISTNKIEYFIIFITGGTEGSSSGRYVVEEIFNLVGDFSSYLGKQRGHKPLSGFPVGRR